MRKIGLDRLDVMAVFRRTLADGVMEDALMESVAKAVGIVIEENNKRLLEDLVVAPKKQGMSRL